MLPPMAASSTTRAVVTIGQRRRLPRPARFRSGDVVPDVLLALRVPQETVEAAADGGQQHHQGGGHDRPAPAPAAPSAFGRSAVTAPDLRDPRVRAVTV